MIRLPLLRPKPDPFATLQGALDALDHAATARRDTRAIGELRAARQVINRECLRAAR